MSRYYKHEKLLMSCRVYEASGGDVFTTLTRRPQSRMAAVQLFFLLFALINNIHAEEYEIKEENDSLTFNITEEADFCLISRFVDEEKLVLWNTSDLWTKNSTVPEDLKQRLSFVNGTHFYSLMIHNLTHSDSGRYQEECWTEGKVTYEKNIRITVCSEIDESKVIDMRLGEEVDLPCEGAADNLDIMWLKSESTYKKDAVKGQLLDSTILVMDNVKNKSLLHVSNFRATDFTEYTCLGMNQNKCVSSHSVYLLVIEIMYHLVEESAELQCTLTDFSDDQPPLWTKVDSESNSYPELGRNYSLSFSSLILNHTGLYFCQTSESRQSFFLVVCPTFVPPVVELFSEGDEVTLRCRDVGEDMWYVWFIKSIQTGGRTVGAVSDEAKLNMSGVTIHLNATLVISNASLAHSGEYWCAVIHLDYQCVSTTKTLLKYREPFGIHSTFYKGRSALLSGLLVVLCAAVVAVTWRTRTRREEET